jgi:putative CocE/NonD family hydrolase
MGGGTSRKGLNGKLQHGGSWHDVDAWPLAGTQYAPYHVHADGTLSTTKPEPSQPTCYTYDPRDPVPTMGGGVSAANDIMPPGGFDQRGDERFYGCQDTLPVAARSDVLVFQTAELDEPIEVTGPITVRLWAASSAIDTDFTAKLIDVHPANADYPDGFSQNISDSIIRARYRNSRNTPAMLRPGQITPFNIVLYPTSNLFGRGHRIRLDISSSNFPRFDINPNTGGELGQDRRVQLAQQAVYHDPEHPTHVVLPIIPTDPPVDGEQ